MITTLSSKTTKITTTSRSKKALMREKMNPPAIYVNFTIGSKVY